MRPGWINCVSSTLSVTSLVPAAAGNTLTGNKGGAWESANVGVRPEQLVIWQLSALPGGFLSLSSATVSLSGKRVAATSITIHLGGLKIQAFREKLKPGEVCDNHLPVTITPSFQRCQCWRQSDLTMRSKRLCVLSAWRQAGFTVPSNVEAEWRCRRLSHPEHLLPSRRAVISEACKVAAITVRYVTKSVKRGTYCICAALDGQNRDAERRF